MDRGLVVGLAAGAGIGFAVCYYLVSKDNNVNNYAKLAAPEQQKQQQQKETESRNISAVVRFFF